MRQRSWIVSLALAVGIAFVSFWYWRAAEPAAMPPGILYANGHV